MLAGGTGLFILATASDALVLSAASLPLLLVHARGARLVLNALKKAC